MSKRKTFTAGQVVEVQRAVGKPWERATYGGPVADMRGWHRIELDPSSPPRIIHRASGVELFEASNDTRTSWRVLVPTQRVRAIHNGASVR